MSLSFIFRHNSIKVKKIGWFGFMFFDFQTKTPVSKILYACLASSSMMWLHKRKESLSTQFISQLSQAFCGILPSCRLRCCAFKLFFVFWGTLRRKSTAYWSCCNAKLGFCSFSNQKQLRTIPTTNWSIMLKRQYSWKSLGNLERTSTRWRICLTVWLRFVTLTQIIFVIKDLFSHNLPSRYI